MTAGDAENGDELYQDTTLKLPEKKGWTLRRNSLCYCIMVMRLLNNQ